MTETKRKEELLSVYLIVGEDELKRDTALKRLRARIAELGDVSFNTDEFVGGRNSGIEIVSACNTLPFASELRLVIVREADKLKGSDAEAVVEYVQLPSPTTVLALAADKLQKNTRLYKAVAAQKSASVIDCAAQKKYELVKTVRRMAANNGIAITERAAQTLIEHVGENTVRLSGELEKIALAHRGKDPIDEHEIRAMVSRTSEVKPWEFAEAFAARDLVRCIKDLNHMSSSSPHALIALCVNRLRELICARSLMARGCTQDLARVLGMPDWKVRNHVTHARNFTSTELRNALIAARDTEQAMKSGANPDTAFVDWIIRTLKR